MKALMIAAVAAVAAVGCAGDLEGGVGEVETEVFTPPAEGAPFGIPGSAPATTPSAALPVQPVGGVGGAGDVSSTGSYVHQVPIEVLPGRAGFQPSVRLAYDSRGGDGVVGMGWALSAGQSVITRCGRTPSLGYRATPNTARVKWTDGVQFDIYDAFCLDGQRMDVVTGTNGVSTAEYRTEMATFSKIVGQVQSGCIGCEHPTFKVFHANGLIGTYTKNGGVDPGGVTLPGMFRAKGAGEIVTLAWPMTRLEDRSGNAIEYVWTKESATAAGQEQSLPRLAEIRYTSCAAAGANTCPYGTAPTRKVKLIYEVRPDARIAYLNGVRLDTKHRLRSIEVYGLASQAASWTYQLGYKTSAFTGRSLLETLQRCVPEGCLPTKGFLWQDSGKTTWNVSALGSAVSTPLVLAGQLGPVTLSSEANASEGSFVLFDADGDGNLDIAFKAWPEGAIDVTTRKLTGSTATLGAGPVDHLAMGTAGSFSGLTTPLDLEGDGNPQASVRCVASPPASALQGEIADFSGTLVVDLDSDGRQELFAPLNTGCPYLGITNPVGIAYNVRVTPSLRQATPTQLSATAAQRVWKVLAMDRTTGRMTKRAEPAPFVNFDTWDTFKYTFADVTGDGLSDVVYGSSRVLSDAVLLAIGSPRVTGTATAEGTIPEVTYLSLTGTNAAYDTQLRFSWQPSDATARTPNMVRALDENGDGRAELKQLAYDTSERGFSLQVDAAGVTKVRRTYYQASTNTSSSQIENVTGPAPPPLWPAYPTATGFIGDTMAWRYLDINGDGLPDALYARRNASTGKHEWFFRINTGLPSYLPEVAVGHIDTLDSYGAAAQLRIVNNVVVAPTDSGLRTADMNGDGREDLVLLGTGNGAVIYATGTGFDTTVFALPSRGSGAVRLNNLGTTVAYPQMQLADLDGDGLTDVVEWVRESATSTRRKLVTVTHSQLPHNAYDVIVEVRDGQSSLTGTNPAESVTYRRLAGWAKSDATPQFDNNGTRVSPPCRFPARCVNRGIAVSRYQDFRSARKVDTTFSYTGARADLQGRGFLGFRVVDRKDEVTGFSSTDSFGVTPVYGFAGQAHFYPGMGTPQRTVALQTHSTVDASLAPTPATAKRARTTRTFTPTYAAAPDGQADIPFRLARGVEETTTADVSPLSQTTLQTEDRSRRTIDTTFDVDGNPTVVIDTVVDLGLLGDSGAPVAAVTTQRTTTNAYLAADYPNWLIGFLRQVSIDATTSDARCAGLANCQRSLSITSFDYETAARKLLLRQHREPTLGATQRTTTVYERDNAGLLRRSRLKDNLGAERVTEVDYDADGLYPRAIRNPAGHTSFFVYDRPRGVLGRAIDPNGNQTSFTYDTIGRLRRTDRADGSFTATSWTKTNETSEAVYAATVTSSDGHDRRTIFDARGRPSQVLIPGFHPSSVPDSTTSVLTQYDALGHVIHTSFTRLGQTFASALTATPTALRTAHASGAEVLSTGLFDLYGRPATSTTGDPNKAGTVEGAGEVTRYLYPRQGDVSVIDAMGHETRTLTDARGLVRRVVQGKEGAAASRVSINHGYGALGQLAYVKADSTPAETFAFDTFGRLTTWTMAGSPNTRSFSYTPFDEVARASEAAEWSVRFAYDALGRPLSRTEDANVNAAERIITFEYDTSAPQGGSAGVVTLGALAKASVEGGHQTRYTYDLKARPYTVTQQFAGGPTLQFGFRYDSVGRASELLYPSFAHAGGTAAGLNVRHEFATNGQLKRVVNVTASKDLWTVTRRHPLGMVQETTVTGGFTTRWAHQLNTLREKQQDIINVVSVPVRQEHTYHPNGLLKTRSFQSTHTETYGYNATGHRLTDYTRASQSMPTAALDVDYTYAAGGDIQSLLTVANASPDWGIRSSPRRRHQQP